MKDDPHENEANPSLKIDDSRPDTDVPHKDWQSISLESWWDSKLVGDAQSTSRRSAADINLQLFKDIGITKDIVVAFSDYLQQIRDAVRHPLERLSVPEPLKISPEAREQSNRYAQYHEVSEPFFNGFRTAGKGTLIGERGEFEAQRAAIVIDVSKDKSLQRIMKEAGEYLDTLGALTPQEKAKALTEWVAKRCGPADGVSTATINAQDQAYVKFMQDNAGKNLMLGDLVDSRLTSCGPQSMLLKLLAEALIPNAKVSLVRGNGTDGGDRINHIWTTFTFSDGKPLIFDPRQGIYGEPAESCTDHKPGNTIVAERLLRGEQALEKPTSTPELAPTVYTREEALKVLQELKGNSAIDAARLRRIETLINDKSIPSDASSFKQVIEVLNLAKAAPASANAGLEIVENRLTLTRQLNNLDSLKSDGKNGFEQKDLNELKRTIERRLADLSKDGVNPKPENIAAVKELAEILTKLNDSKTPKEPMRMQVLADMLRLHIDHPERAINFDRILDSRCKPAYLRHWCELFKHSAGNRLSGGDFGDVAEHGAAMGIERGLATGEITVGGKKGPWVFVPGGKGTPADGQRIDGEFINLETGEICFSDVTMSPPSKQTGTKDKWAIDIRPKSAERKATGGPEYISYDKPDQMRELIENFFDRNPVNRFGNRPPRFHVNDFAPEIGVPSHNKPAHPSFRTVKTQQEADDLTAREGKKVRTAVEEMKVINESLAQFIKNNATRSDIDEWKNLQDRIQSSICTTAFREQLGRAVRDGLLDAATWRAAGYEPPGGAGRPKITGFGREAGTNKAYVEFDFGGTYKNGSWQSGELQAQVTYRRYNPDGSLRKPNYIDSATISKVRIYEDGQIVGIRSDAAGSGEVQLGNISDFAGELRGAVPDGIPFNPEKWKEMFDNLNPEAPNFDTIKLKGGKYDPQGTETKIDWTNKAHRDAFFEKYNHLEFDTANIKIDGKNSYNALHGREIPLNWNNPVHVEAFKTKYQFERMNLETIELNSKNNYERGAKKVTIDWANPAHINALMTKYPGLRLFGEAVDKADVARKAATDARTAISDFKDLFSDTALKKFGDKFKASEDTWGVVKPGDKNAQSDLLEQYKEALTDGLREQPDLAKKLFGSQTPDKINVKVEFGNKTGVTYDAATDTVTVTVDKRLADPTRRMEAETEMIQALMKFGATNVKFGSSKKAGLALNQNAVDDLIGERTESMIDALDASASNSKGRYFNLKQIIDLHHRIFTPDRITDFGKAFANSASLEAGLTNYLRGQPGLAKLLGIQNADGLTVKVEFSGSGKPEMSYDQATNTVTVKLPESMKDPAKRTLCEAEIFKVMAESTARGMGIDVQDGGTKGTLDAAINGSVRKLLDTDRYKGLDMPGGDGSISTHVTRPPELVKDAQDYLKKEQLAEPRIMKQYLYEARTLLTGRLEDINKNKSLNAEQRAIEMSKAINEFNEKYFKILHGKNLQNAQILRNLRVQPLKAGEPAGLSFESMTGQPLSIKDGKIVDAEGKVVAPANVRPVYRIPEGLFSNPQLIFQEIYCGGLLGTKQALDLANRTAASGKNVGQVSAADSVSRDLARDLFRTSTKEAVANELKVAMESGRKAAGEGYFETERAALTQLHRAELTLENGVATFRGSSLDLVATARERINELEKQLEKLRRVREGKETDETLPKDPAELEKLEKTLVEKLAEYRPAYEAAVNKNFEPLHKIAGREIPEMLAEAELLRQAGEADPARAGGGRWKAYVFLFAGVAALLIGSAQPASAAPSTPVYAPVVPKK